MPTELGKVRAQRLLTEKAVTWVYTVHGLGAEEIEIPAPLPGQAVSVVIVGVAATAAKLQLLLLLLLLLVLLRLLLLPSLTMQLLISVPVHMLHSLLPTLSLFKTKPAQQ